MPYRKNVVLVPTGTPGNGGDEPSIRIEDGSGTRIGVGSVGTMDWPLPALLDGKISEATYNRSLDAMRAVSLTGQ
jgi:hypothetical protein